jgi:hypothetical protein
MEIDQHFIQILNMQESNYELVKTFIYFVLLGLNTSGKLSNTYEETELYTRGGTKDFA